MMHHSTVQIPPFLSPFGLKKTSGDLQTTKTYILKIICDRIPKMIHWFSHSAHLEPTDINMSHHTDITSSCIINFTEQSHETCTLNKHI